MTLALAWHGMAVKRRVFDRLISRYLLKTIFGPDCFRHLAWSSLPAEHQKCAKRTHTHSHSVACSIATKRNPLTAHNRNELTKLCPISFNQFSLVNKLQQQLINSQPASQPKLLSQIKHQNLNYLEKWLTQSISFSTFIFGDVRAVYVGACVCV